MKIRYACLTVPLAFLVVLPLAAQTIAPPAEEITVIPKPLIVAFTGSTGFFFASDSAYQQRLGSKVRPVFGFGLRVGTQKIGGYFEKSKVKALTSRPAPTKEALFEANYYTIGLLGNARLSEQLHLRMKGAYQHVSLSLEGRANGIYVNQKRVNQSGLLLGAGLENEVAKWLRLHLDVNYSYCESGNPELKGKFSGVRLEFGTSLLLINRK